MPHIQYIDKRFSKASQDIIEKAVVILDEYAGQGLDLTLRQLYYQFVARGYIDNQQKEYNRLGRIISDARMCGLIDWNMIEDRTRNLRNLSHWDRPADIISACAHSYRIDKWADQYQRVEVWIEKDALVGVLESVCPKLDVPYFSCRGYTSMSEMWRAGQRMNNNWDEFQQQTTILHLGDHDPSGIDMSRDIADRLDTFTNNMGIVTVKRIALTMDQINELNPPPNPAKLTDSRASDYISRFGTESWELDALDPSYMVTLIEEEVAALRDEERWNHSQEEEEKSRELLKRLSSRCGTNKQIEELLKEE